MSQVAAWELNVVLCQPAGLAKQRADDSSHIPASSSIGPLVLLLKSNEFKAKISLIKIDCKSSMNILHNNAIAFVTIIHTGIVTN